MTRRGLHAAIDLGAGSGRVLLGAVHPHAVDVQEVHRFHYAARRVAGRLRWDASQLFDGIREGLRQAAAAAVSRGTLTSVGVDSWGVDYGIIDEAGRLLEDPICYRDERLTAVMARAFATVPRREIFRATGIQFLPFNTLYQLLAHVEAGLPRDAARLLLIPDLCHHHLCGSTTSEPTNASTTQLLNVETARWDEGLVTRFGLPGGLLPDQRPAGALLGTVRDDLLSGLNLPCLSVVQPATHDTASAVAGTPLVPGWAYISSGTWSLVGVERGAPLVADAVLDANFTNERGVSDTFRFLTNVMGLWILEACRREWRAAGVESDLPALLARASEIDEIGGLVFPDDPRFLNPPSMLLALRDALVETGQQPPDDPVLTTKVILDSLALRYASVLETIERLTDSRVAGVHIVGGGALNGYLNQATANACGRPVLAGPVEATAIGNLLVQAVAAGTIDSIAAGRRAVAAAFPPIRYEPHSDRRWRDAALRFRGLAGR